MRPFTYRALDDEGSVQRGSVLAEREADVAGLLWRRQLHLVEVREGSDSTLAGTLAARDRARVLGAMAEYLHSGITLDGALRLAESSEHEAKVRRAIGEARRLVGEGEAPAVALRAAALVTPLHALMLSAGERAGRLADALQRVATAVEYEREVQRRLAKALVYPGILFFTGVGTIIVLVAVVVPRFAALSESLGQELPPALGALMALREMVSEWWWLCLLLACTGALAVWRLRGATGSVQGREVLGRLPLVRPVVATWESAAHARAIGALLESGFPLLRTMQHLRSTVHRAESGAAMARVVERLVAGERLVASLLSEGVMPRSVAPLLEIGESAGALAAAFSKAGAVLQQRAEERVEALLTLVQPLLVLALGAAIAVLAGSLLQSIYAIRPMP